jgi:alpha-glucosidase
MKKIISILFLSFLFLSKSFGEFVFIGDIKSFKQFDDRIEFKLENSIFNIYIYDNNIIRLRYTNKEKFSEAPSYAVITKPSNVSFNFKDENVYYEISTNEIIVRISKSPCRVSFYDKQMNLINEDDKTFGIDYDFDEVKCYKKLFKDEKFYGLGEKTGPLNRTGNDYVMWNSDKPRYTNDTDPIYQSIPFFIGVRDAFAGSQSKSAYGIFFDNSYKSSFNMGASNDRFYSFGAEKGELDYYFIYGPEIKKVISSYTKLTGRMELPPEWALGYQQSKWSYYPESTVRTIANTFRNKEIPCDVIYLDIHYMNGYRVFTWNKDRFPHPEKMLKDLKDEGFKIITIVDPGVKADTTDYPPAKEGLEKNLFAKYPDGIPYKGEVWPSWAYFPDFTKTETRDWWGEKNAGLIKQGVSGIWNDMNEPAAWGQAIPDIVQFDDQGYGASMKKIHNVFGLEMARATFSGIKKEFPGKRPFILTRAGFSGIQRYAAVWTGDNIGIEEHLKLACVMPQGMGISGIVFCGSDVGGFFGSPTPNLYTRWMQLGGFTPFFRGHSIIDQRDKEPWAFGDQVEGWVKNIITLRYKLLPFLYNEFYNASQTGVPIMRPMFLEFQNDDECYSNDAQYQFMIGNNLLVAPVVSENEDFKKLYLPEGKWLDWWNSKIYDGKQWIIVQAPMDEIPLFIKEGGIIPIQEKQNFVGEKNISKIEFKIFLSNNSDYNLYQDDGITTNYKNGEFSLTNINVKTDGNKTEIVLKKEVDKYDSKLKSFLFDIYNISNVQLVQIDGNKISQLNNIDEIQNADSGFYFDKENNLLKIKINYSPNLKLDIQ